MAGTTSGGQKAAETNKKKYGDGFYARIGQKGGRNGHLQPTQNLQKSQVERAV